jgi:hypothetical protein
MATYTIKRGKGERIVIAEYNGWTDVRLVSTSGLPAGFTVSVVPSGIYYKVYLIGSSMAPAGSYPILVVVNRYGVLLGDVSPRTITPTIKLVDPMPSESSNTGGSGGGSGGSGGSDGDSDSSPDPGNEPSSPPEGLLTWFQAQAEALAGARIRLMTDNDRWFEYQVAVWYVQLFNPTTKVLTTRRIVQASDWSVDRFRSKEWTLDGIPGQPASAGNVWRTVDPTLSFP